MPVAEGIASRAVRVGSYTPLQLQSAIACDIEDLDADLVRRIITICFAEGMDEHGAAIANAVITSPAIDVRESDPRVASAAGALSFFAAKDWELSGKGSVHGREEVFRLLGHRDDSVVCAMISSMSHGVDFEIFRKIAGFMANENAALRKAARRYAETMTGDMAFAWEDRGMHSHDIMDFLRMEAAVLRSLEPAVVKLGDRNLQSRLSIMISLVYNHLLKGFRNLAEMTWEGEDRGRYYGTQGYVSSRLAPRFHGALFRKLRSRAMDDYTDLPKDERVRLCVVETLERMGSNENLRPVISGFLREHSRISGSEDVRDACKEAAHSLESGFMRFRLSKPPHGRISIFPKTSMPPPIRK